MDLSWDMGLSRGEKGGWDCRLQIGGHVKSPASTSASRVVQPQAGEEDA